MGPDGRDTPALRKRDAIWLLVGIYSPCEGFLLILSLKEAGCLSSFLEKRLNFIRCSKIVLGRLPAYGVVVWFCSSTDAKNLTLIRSLEIAKYILISPIRHKNPLCFPKGSLVQLKCMMSLDKSDWTLVVWISKAFKWRSWNDDTHISAFWQCLFLQGV